MQTEDSLKALFADLPFAVLSGEVAEARVTTIAADSRTVESGALFVALRGGSADGHDHIPDAIRRGAAALVGDRPMTGLTVPYVQVPDTRRALPYLAAAHFRHPARRLTMIGITGTDGKTTTSNLLYRILIRAGYRAGLISTVNAVIGDEVLDTGFHVTTPEAPDVQGLLARMLDAGMTHVVLETTSHGLAQHRVDACEFDVGIVTNITHEHLDFHGTFENYRAAKGRLFSSLAETRPKPQGNIQLAVLNRDDQSYDFLEQLTTVSKISYGLAPQADFRAVNIESSAAGLRFEANGNGFRTPVSTALVGAYNVSNCLAALTAAVVGLGIDAKVAAAGIASLPGVPGRMERIDLGQAFTAIVDFAHTPNALEAALKAARQMTGGRVIAVFGSAGLRDQAKRRLMAEVSAGLADFSVLTAEDPRSESLDAILFEMAAGAQSRGGVEDKNFWRIPDRGEAIRFAVRMAQPGDVVIACGKGHEQSMCFGTLEYPWDDRIAMRAALAELLHVDGPHMPYLPTQEQQ